MSLDSGQSAGVRFEDCFDDTERFFRKAPEGMPELQKLLEKSAEIGKELAKYDNLATLADAFDDLDQALLDLSLDLRTGMRSYRDEQLPAYLSPHLFCEVFAFHPLAQSTPGKQLLLDTFEEDLDYRWEYQAKPIHRIMKEFWDLWLPASEEIEERGKATRRLYRAFRWANQMLADMKNAPRIDRYGQLSTIGTEDARTIHSAFSNFDPEAKETYTAASARRMADFLCMWADPQMKKSPADSSQDTNRSSADMDVSEIGTASTGKRYRLTRYDPTLISRYVLPRLGDVDERLHESIHNAGKRLAIKSYLARQARKPDAAKDLSRAA